MSEHIRRDWIILPTPIHHDEVVTVRVHFAKGYRHEQIQNQIRPRDLGARCPREVIQNRLAGSDAFGIK